MLYNVNPRFEFTSKRKAGRKRREKRGDGRIGGEERRRKRKYRRQEERLGEGRRAEEMEEDGRRRKKRRQEERVGEGRREEMGEKESRRKERKGEEMGREVGERRRNSTYGDQRMLNSQQAWQVTAPFHHAWQQRLGLITTYLLQVAGEKWRPATLNGHRRGWQHPLIMSNSNY